MYISERNNFFTKKDFPVKISNFADNQPQIIGQKKKPSSELAIIHAEINDNRSPNNSPPISDLSLHVTSLNLAKGKGHEWDYNSR